MTFHRDIIIIVAFCHIVKSNITVMLIWRLNTELGYDKAVDRQWSCATPSYSTDLRSKERRWGKESRMYKLRNIKKGLYNQTLLVCTQHSVGGHVSVSSYCNWIRQSDCWRTKEKFLFHSSSSCLSRKLTGANNNINDGSSIFKPSCVTMTVWVSPHEQYHEYETDQLNGIHSS